MYTDTQIKEENFLEDIGNLLNTGEVPNMFPIDEKNEICSKMRQIDKSVITPVKARIQEVYTVLSRQNLCI